MGARRKLNEIYLTGSLIVAALAGLATDSWPAFLASLLALIAIGRLGDAIRPAGRGL